MMTIFAPNRLLFCLGGGISVRAFFARGGGGRWTICPKNSLKLPKLLRNSRKETRVIRCTDNGLHMKWKYFYVWMYHMSPKNTLKLKRNSCLFHFDGRRYQWHDPCHCWLELAYVHSVLISAMLPTRSCPMVLRRYCCAAHWMSALLNTVM